MRAKKRTLIKNIIVESITSGAPKSRRRKTLFGIAVVISSDTRGENHTAVGIDANFGCRFDTGRM